MKQRLAKHPEVFCFPIQFPNDHWGPREEPNHLWNAQLVPRDFGGSCTWEGLLTWLVFLPLGDDSQSVHIKPQVPGYSLQQDDREGTVGVGVVDQGADLPSLQPVPTHVAVSMEDRCGQLRYHREKDTRMRCYEVIFRPGALTGGAG